MLPVRVYYCRMCETEMVPDDNYCPQCGVYGRTGKSDPVEILIKDVVLSVLLGIVVLSMTLPATFLVAIEFLRMGRNPTDQFDVWLCLTIWNGYLCGFPASILIRHWRRRIIYGEFGYTWIWHHYWRAQGQTIAPILIVAVFPMLILIGFWLSSFFV